MINTTQLDVNLPNANLRIEDISDSTTTVTLPVLLSPLPNETEKPADQALSGRETVAASAGESPKADEKNKRYVVSFAGAYYQGVKKYKKLNNLKKK